MPPDGMQVGVFGYAGAARLPLGKNYMATPEMLFTAMRCGITMGGSSTPITG
jgi:hypothetical protein